MADIVLELGPPVPAYRVYNVALVVCGSISINLNQANFGVISVLRDPVCGYQNL